MPTTTKRGPGRPPKPPRVRLTLDVPPETAEALEARAESDEVTRHAAAVAALERGLRRRK